MLNEKEQNKYNIIKKIVDGTMTRKEAMIELRLSRQQIYRLINLYDLKGEKRFIHVNHGKQNHKEKHDKLIQDLNNLYL